MIGTEASILLDVALIGTRILDILLYAFVDTSTPRIFLAVLAIAEAVIVVEVEAFNKPIL